MNKDALVLPNIVDLDMDLNNFEYLFSNSFLSSDLFIQLYNKKSSENPLLKSFQFVYQSIIRDDDIKNQYIGFENVFNIVWWRGLLEGNWQNFQNIFKERRKNLMYLLHSGVSGLMVLPSLEKTTKPSNLILSEENKYVQTPAYIWSYFQPLENNLTEKFVIIGHNTPFYDTDSATDFCEDMCKQIDWLKDSLFEKLHLMPVFGVVNCCRPEDVANKLDNFPFEEKQLTANNEIFTERTLT